MKVALIERSRMNLMPRNTLLARSSARRTYQSAMMRGELTESSLIPAIASEKNRIAMIEKFTT